MGKRVIDAEFMRAIVAGKLRGLTDPAVARELHCSTDTIERARANDQFALIEEDMVRNFNPVDRARQQMRIARAWAVLDDMMKPSAPVWARLQAARMVIEVEARRAATDSGRIEVQLDPSMLAAPEAMDDDSPSYEDDQPTDV